MYYNNRLNTITTAEAEQLLATLNNTALTLNAGYKEYIYSLEEEKEKLQAALGIKKLNSSVEVAAAIQYEYPNIVFPKTGTGKPSVTKDFLISIANGRQTVLDIIKARELAYKVSHYPKGNILQPHYEAHLNTTGRIYSSQPNIQGLPELYQYIEADCAYKIDFNQQELNLLAKLTDDKILGRDLVNGDFFAALGSDLGLSREEAKTKTYAGIYMDYPYDAFIKKYPVAGAWLCGKSSEEKNYPLQHWGALYMYDLLEVFDEHVLISIHDAIIVDRLSKEQIHEMMQVFDIPYKIEKVKKEA